MSSVDGRHMQFEYSNNNLGTCISEDKSLDAKMLLISL